MTNRITLYLHIKKSDQCLRCYSNICKFGWRLVLVWTPKRNSIDSSSRNRFVLGTIHVLLSTGVLCWNVMVHNRKCSCWSDNKWSDYLHRSELLATRLYVTVVRTDYLMGVWSSGLLVCSHMISLSGLNAQISLSASCCAALYCCQSCIIKMFFLLCLSACFEKEAVFKSNSSVWLEEFLFLIFYVLKLLSHESREYFFILGIIKMGFLLFLANVGFLPWNSSMDAIFPSSLHLIESWTLTLIEAIDTCQALDVILTSFDLLDKSSRKGHHCSNGGPPESQRVCNIFQTNICQLLCFSTVSLDHHVVCCFLRWEIESIYICYQGVILSFSHRPKLNSFPLVN